MRAIMSEKSDPLCFQCGRPVTSPPQVNLLPNGDTCPQCRDRFVDALPPLLPGHFGAGIDGGGEFPELEEAGEAYPERYVDDSEPA
jgi:hypothetical protein